MIYLLVSTVVGPLVLGGLAGFVGPSTGHRWLLIELVLLLFLLFVMMASVPAPSISTVRWWANIVLYLVLAGMLFKQGYLLGQKGQRLL